MSSVASRRTSTGATPESLTLYLQEIAAYPMLERVDELALATRIRAGDDDALDRLVCANLRFVVSVAKTYQHHGVPLVDLIDEGNLGLMRAARKFDEAKGVKFISYAVWWVRQAILQALANDAHVVRVPVHRAGTLRRLHRRANTLRQELGREPTAREIADGTPFSEAEIAKTRSNLCADLSLDAPSGPAGGILLDHLADDLARAPDNGTVDDVAASIQRALSRLKGREARVLALHFGLDGEEPMTLEEIGARFGITRERVRQIKVKALSRLRKQGNLSAFAG